jgi:LAO/AO transport system kinase
MDDTTRQLARDVLHEHNAENNNDNSGGSPSHNSSSSSMLKRRIALSRSITLLETKSLHTYKQKQADALLTYLLEHKTDSSSRKTSVASSTSRQNFRIGLAGPPGAGKSSLIEALGMYILEQLPLQPETKAQSQHKDDQEPLLQSENWYSPSKLAVVCVDPSSSVSGGSILGDKTRMMELSRNERAFIRPSANAGVVGGLAAYTDDVVTCCQAAGYPLVLVETVGLGQSEIEVAQSVDMVLLLLSPGGGDDLQGVKKGIVEVADLLVVTKADGTLLPAAKRTAADYRGALQLLKGIESANRQSTTVPSTSNSSDSCSEENGNRRHRRHNTNEPDVLTWSPPVLLTSSATKEGLDILWKEICKYRQYKIQTGLLEERRKEQATYWMWKHLSQLVHVHIHHRDPALQREAQQLQATLDRGQVTPRVAATRLLNRLLLKNND